MNDVVANRYSRPTIALHWLVLLLMVVVYACMELRGFAPRGSALRDAMKTVHFQAGLLVWVLVWVRLAFRLRGPTPPIVPAPPAWQSALGHLVHVALYGLMIAMPLIGWGILSAEGKAVNLLGIGLPALVAPSHDLAEQLEGWHETIANLGYALVALHAAAAVAHHHLVGDNTLRRMLPGRG